MHAEAFGIRLGLRAGDEPYPGYRLRRLIGRGGFSEVWHADRDDGTAVALKFLPCASDSAATEEVRSIQIVRGLRHPGLIPIYQVWSGRGCLVLSMELADGSLLDLLDAYQEESGAALPAAEVCELLAQAAAALDFLNAPRHVLRGRAGVAVQHCDVKPSNLLLCGDAVKVCDFGLTSALSGALAGHRRAGTVEYAAPEVFRGQLSARTDQYALAVSYCQLRGGRLPFPDNPPTFRRSYTRPAPDLSMLPAAEGAVIRRALAPAPWDRWPSCGDLIARLAAAVGVRAA
jgi:serine/threonine protein kinase